jgi:hypothetical protein
MPHITYYYHLSMWYVLLGRKWYVYILPTVQYLDDFEISWTE